MNVSFYEALSKGEVGLGEEPSHHTVTVNKRSLIEMSIWESLRVFDAISTAILFYYTVNYYVFCFI